MTDPNVLPELPDNEEEAGNVLWRWWFNQKNVGVRMRTVAREILGLRKKIKLQERVLLQLTDIDEGEDLGIISVPAHEVDDFKKRIREFDIETKVVEAKDIDSDKKLVQLLTPKEIR